MTKNQKLWGTILGVAVVGGAIWYMRNKNKKTTAKTAANNGGEEKSNFILQKSGFCYDVSVDENGDWDLGQPVGVAPCPQAGTLSGGGRRNVFGRPRRR